MCPLARMPLTALRRVCCLLAAAGIALLAAGCGAGVKAADLFVVERSGTTPGARVTLRRQRRRRAAL